MKGVVLLDSVVPVQSSVLGRQKAAFESNIGDLMIDKNQDDYEPISTNPNRVLGQAVKKAAADLGCSDEELQRLIGCSFEELDELTSSDEYSFTHRSMRSSVYLLKLHRALCAMYGNDPLALRRWMRMPHKKFGMSPIEHLNSEQALNQTVSYLEAGLSR